MNNWEKKWICTNFLPAKIQKLRSKSRAKMINVTFAYQNHRIVSKEANVEFAIFSPIALKFS